MPGERTNGCDPRSTATGDGAAMGCPRPPPPIMLRAVSRKPRWRSTRCSGPRRRQAGPTRCRRDWNGSEAVFTRRHWENSPIGFYFAKLWYYERLYPLVFTVAALGHAVRHCSPPQQRTFRRVRAFHPRRADGGPKTPPRERATDFQPHRCRNPVILNCRSTPKDLLP